MSASEDDETTNRVHGHAPLVRRRKNQGIEDNGASIQVNTGALINKAVDAGVTTLTALAVDRIIKE